MGPHSHTSARRPRSHINTKSITPAVVVLEQEMYRYPDWQASNLWPLINPTIRIGQTRELGGAVFTLEERLFVGNGQVCPHLTGMNWWYVYRVHYTTAKS